MGTKEMRSAPTVVKEAVGKFKWSWAEDNMIELILGFILMLLIGVGLQRAFAGHNTIDVNKRASVLEDKMEAGLLKPAGVRVQEVNVRHENSAAKKFTEFNRLAHQQRQDRLNGFRKFQRFQRRSVRARK